jgi:hypothetical protein
MKGQMVIIKRSKNKKKMSGKYVLYIINGDLIREVLGGRCEKKLYCNESHYKRK